MVRRNLEEEVNEDSAEYHFNKLGIGVYLFAGALILGLLVGKELKNYSLKDDERLSVERVDDSGAQGYDL